MYKDLKDKGLEIGVVPDLPYTGCNFIPTGGKAIVNSSIDDRSLDIDYRNLFIRGEYLFRTRIRSGSINVFQKGYPRKFLAVLVYSPTLGQDIHQSVVGRDEVNQPSIEGLSGIEKEILGQASIQVLDGCRQGTICNDGTEEMFPP